MVDESGEIRATAFNAECEKFYHMIEVFLKHKYNCNEINKGSISFQPNKVYYISSAALKTANKQFNNCKNDYEMTLNQTTTVSRERES